ncbi:PQQ-binding-like beta-propeller repeat protein [Thermodesulfobacteriota bacterium]
MKKERKSLILCLFILAVAIGVIYVTSCQNTVKNPQSQAKALIEEAGLKGGLIVHLNCGEGRLTEALRLNDSYQVQGLDSQKNNVQKAREYIMSKDKYGPVSIGLLKGNELPYNDNFVNMIVIDDPGKISKDEVMRVLTPNGVLLTKAGSKWDVERKPVPKEMDEWNQYLYNSEGNMVSKDEIVSPIKHYQWIGGPRWSRHHDTKSSLSAMVSADGRIFYIMDEGPKNSVILPADNYLTARDAYNGTILWKKSLPEGTVGHLFPLKSGPAYLPRRLIAAGDKVYATLGNYAVLSELDAATGEVIRSFPDTEDTSEIILSGNTLFLLIGRPEKKEELFAAKKTSVWANMDVGRFEWGWNKEPAKIVSINLPDGKINWTKKYTVAPLSLIADSGSVYFHDGDNLVSLERENGGEKWKTEAKRRIEGRPVVQGSTDLNMYETGYATRLLVHDDVLLFSNGLQEIVAFSAADGKKLWNQRQPASGHYSPEDIFVIDGLVWTGATAMPNQPGNYIGWDLHTGELKKDMPNDAGDIYWFHQRCYPSRATENYFLPSKTGIEFVDTEKGHWDINHYARGSCSYGIMPSNGLVYAPPSACACYMEAKLFGISALGGNIQSGFSLEEAAKENRLEKGPAYSADIKDDSDTHDWSTYRHNAGRTGSTPVEVSADATTKWRLKLGGKLSSPVSSGSRVYVAQVDAHTLHAIDSASGNILWSYTAGGRVDSPPTVYKGRVLFGSADGYVYSLNSADGELIWRFRAAPKDRRMMAFNQVESVWPVHGSVLIQNDRLYCVAGRTMFLDGGIRFLILDPVTGKMIDEKIMDENDPDTGENMHKYVKNLDMAVGLADILSSDGEHIYMRSQQFDLNGNRKNIAVRNFDDQFGEGAHIFSPIGFLDDSFFYRATMLYGKTIKGGWGGWGMAGKLTPAGRILVADDVTVYGYGPKPEFLTESIITEYSLYAADKNGSSSAVEEFMKTGGNMWYPGAGDWKQGQSLPKIQMSAVQFKWQVDKPDIFARAMVLADKTLFVAGPPDILDEEGIYFFLNDEEIKEELARQYDLHKGKEGGRMWAVSAGTGEKLKEFELDSLPVWDGMAASKGQLYISTMGGELLCYK